MNEQNKTTKAPKLEVKLNFEMPTVIDLLEAGIHFGHEAKRWNPKMREYIYAKRGNIHIIDLAKTLKQLEVTLKFLKKAAQRGDVIFVGTKRQACDVVKEAALESGSHYIINRWAGGLLTNYSIVRKSLKKYKQLEKDLSVGVENRTKQEIAWMKKDYERYSRLYEGVKHLSEKPTAIVVIDAKREKIAVKEARSAGVPVVALVDTNVDPDLIDYIIPGNDDAISAIGLVVKLMAKAIAEGNEGKRLAAIRKNYDSELKQAKTKAAYEKQKRVFAEKELRESKAKAREEAAVVRISGKSGEKKVASAKKKVTKKKAVSKVKKKLVKDLSELNLSTRTEKALVSAGIDAAGAAGMTAEDLKAVKGVGPKAVEEILAAVSKVK